MSNAMRSFRYLLAPYGSSGDVYPFLGLGKALQARGHSVLLAAAGEFAAAAQKCGVDFLELGKPEDYHALTRNPDLWHPQKGPATVMRTIARLLPDYVKRIEPIVREPDTVVVAPGTNFGAWYLCRKLGRPLITVHLQPVLIFSVEEMPVMMAGMEWICRMPRWMRRLVFRVPSPADVYIRPVLKKYCQGAGLPVPRRLLLEWWNSPEGVVCFFPEWFAAPQRDWPKPVEQTNFPLFDLAEQSATDEALERFLDEGEPPVAVTAGSAMQFSKDFFRMTADVCARLRRRLVLITAYDDQVPQPLPPHVFLCRFVPFSKLFSRCAAVVHHGGIGTVSQVFAAGIPQVVCPMTHDQPDNAMRVQRLRAGTAVPFSKLNGERLENALREVLESSEIRQKARALGQKLAIRDGCEAAARAVEAFSLRSKEGRVGNSGN